MESYHTNSTKLNMSLLILFWICSGKFLSLLPVCIKVLFMLILAVFLGCTSTGRVDLCFLWFFVQELPKAQPAVVLVLKRLRRWGNGLKSHPTDWEKPGSEPATPGLQDKKKLFVAFPG